jgi:uncharacterized membrane protein YcaP (DUF421 family)
MELQELVMTALRALAVYAFMLVVIRLLGKRTVGNFTAFDLLVALMLGEVVDEIIYGDVTLLQGGLAIAVVALAQYGNTWLSYLAHGMDKILEGVPTVVVRNGTLQREGMRKERMNEKDVMGELRLNGIDDLREVKLAVIENEGNLSVLKETWAEPVQKADVGGKAGDRKAKATKGKDEPPGDKDTGSRRSLGQEG